jgi:hypothetical protein
MTDAIILFLIIPILATGYSSGVTYARKIGKHTCLRADGQTSGIFGAPRSLKII